MVASNPGGFTSQAWTVSPFQPGKVKLETSPNWKCFSASALIWVKAVGEPAACVRLSRKSSAGFERSVFEKIRNVPSRETSADPDEPAAFLERLFSLEDPRD